MTLLLSEMERKRDVSMPLTDVGCAREVEAPFCRWCYIAPRMLICLLKNQKYRSVPSMCHLTNKSVLQPLCSIKQVHSRCRLLLSAQ